VLLDARVTALETERLVEDGKEQIAEIDHKLHLLVWCTKKMWDSWARLRGTDHTLPG
jgi:hypothetical protein